jgi:hypothetical protein
VHRVRGDKPDLTVAFGDYERQQPRGVGLAKAQSADLSPAFLNVDNHRAVPVGFFAFPGVISCRAICDTFASSQSKSIRTYSVHTHCAQRNREARGLQTCELRAARGRQESAGGSVPRTMRNSGLNGGKPARSSYQQNGAAG